MMNVVSHQRPVLLETIARPLMIPEPDEPLDSENAHA
jgi:hypothetical protein